LKPLKSTDRVNGKVKTLEKFGFGRLAIQIGNIRILQPTNKYQYGTDNKGNVIVNTGSGNLIEMAMVFRYVLFMTFTTKKLGVLSQNLTTNLFKRAKLR
jgi:hypothetical protein